MIMPPAVMTHEFHDAVLQMMWEWASNYAYWAGRYQPIEDEV